MLVGAVASFLVGSLILKVYPVPKKVTGEDEEEAAPARSAVAS